MFANQNQINVRIDEVDEVVEMFDEEFDNRGLLNDLKAAYSSVISKFNFVVKFCTKRINRPKLQK